MRDTDWLFLNTMDDLQARLNQRDPYSILGVSALLRKLLVDDDPLAFQVNRKYRLGFKFSVTVFRPRTEALAWSVGDGLDPNTTIVKRQVQQLKLDKFLKVRVLVMRGNVFTVHDIIKFEANVMGGVHAGAPRRPEDEILLAAERFFGVGGYPSVLRSLLPIGRVAHAGLLPLSNYVRSQTTD